VVKGQGLENCQGLHVLQTVRYVSSPKVHKFSYCHRAPQTPPWMVTGTVLPRPPS